MVIGITWARGSGSSLPGKNKYPILGKPLIHYSLKSLRMSGIVDHHYVFTEDDEISQTTLDEGWKVIPRPKQLLKYSGKNFSMDKAWRLITEHVAADLALELPRQPENWRNAFFRLTGEVFTLNCNNVMLRSTTFRRMREFQLKHKVCSVVPAVRIEVNLMLGMPGGYVYPLWDKGAINRQEFPPLLQPLSSTRVQMLEHMSEDAPHLYYVEVSEVEGMDVHAQQDVDFIEFYLERHRDYFEETGEEQCVPEK